MESYTDEVAFQEILKSITDLGDQLLSSDRSRELPSANMVCGDFDDIPAGFSISDLNDLCNLSMRYMELYLKPIEISTNTSEVQAIQPVQESPSQYGPLQLDGYFCFQSYRNKLESLIQYVDIWKRIDCTGLFEIVFEDVTYYGQNWWSILPCGNYLREILSLELSIYGIKGPLFIGGTYFKFSATSKRIQPIDRESIIFDGHLRRIKTLSSTRFDRRVIFLPFEFSTKFSTRSALLSELIRSAFNNQEEFILFNRRVKFIGNGLYRVGSYNDWYSDTTCEKLSLEETTFKHNILGIDLLLPFEWMIEMHFPFSDGIKHLKAHLINSPDALNMPFQIGSYKWIIQDSFVKRYFGL